MARIAKSLKAPEQGYRHRDHRSSKGRTKKASRTMKRKNFAFKTKKMIEEEIAKMTEADLYDIQMQPIRNRWRAEKW